jgi:hypothetical protein
VKILVHHPAASPVTRMMARRAASKARTFAIRSSLISAVPVTANLPQPAAWRARERKHLGHPRNSQAGCRICACQIQMC